MKNNILDLIKEKNINLILNNKSQNIIDKDDELSILKYLEENIDEISEWIKSGTGSMYNLYTDNDKKYTITLKMFTELSDDERLEFHEKGNYGQFGFIISNVEIEYDDSIIII